MVWFPILLKKFPKGNYQCILSNRSIFTTLLFSLRMKSVVFILKMSLPLLSLVLENFILSTWQPWEQSLSCAWIGTLRPTKYNSNKRMLSAQCKNTKISARDVFLGRWSSVWECYSASMGMWICTTSTHTKLGVTVHSVHCGGRGRLAAQPAYEETNEV